MKKKRLHIAAGIVVLLLSTGADFDMSAGQTQGSEEKVRTEEADAAKEAMRKADAVDEQEESVDGQRAGSLSEGMPAENMLPEAAGDGDGEAGELYSLYQMNRETVSDEGDADTAAQKGHPMVNPVIFTEETGSDDDLYLPEDGVIEEEPAPQFYAQGVSHSSVAEIQQRLMDLGFMDYAEPTMYYGSITMEAVKMFQRQHELKEDGIIGPQTKELLFSENAKYYLAKAGMKGDDIKRIQQRLYEMGYLAKADQVTGYFGDVTEKAVKQMQENNGLAADGKVGHDTIEMLYSENAKANLLSYGDKSDVVKECQERLKELGYLTTKPDGQYGKDTSDAVKRFQSRNDIVVDGYLGSSTMSVLHSSYAVPNGIVVGDTGDSVKRLQELLAKYGYLAKTSCTGYFGEVTEAAVKTFQKNNGLYVDGNVGRKTMNKLTDGTARAAGSNSTLASTGSSGSQGSTGTGSGNSSSAAGSGSTSSSVASLLAVAKSKLGCRYVYGSKGPNTFDCSGYVYWCLNQVGVRQSYITSYGWRTVGKYQKITSFSSIKAGDIVVVKGHVGIAAGNGMVYDASSSSGKIVYRSLGDWWKKNFICAWRIF